MSLTALNNSCRVNRYLPFGVVSMALAILFLCASLLNASQHSLPYLTLNGEKIFLSEKPVFVPQYGQFAEDLLGNWTAKDVFKGKYDAQFFNSKSEFGNFGFTQSAYWLRFEIDFEQSVLVDELLFVVNAATLDEVSIFVRDSKGNITQTHSGYRQGQGSRDLQHHNHVYRLLAEQGGEFLVRAKTNTSLVFPLEIWQEKQFYQQTYIDTLLLGAYYGLLLVMFFYNLFIFVSTRDKSFLFYVLFLFFYGGLQFTLDGFLSLWLWKDYTDLKFYDLVLFSTLSIISSLLFGMNFLNTKHVLPDVHKVMVVTIWFTVLVSLLIVVTQGKAFSLIAYVTLWVTVLLFAAGILAWKGGQPGAQFFVLAWLFLLLGTATYIVQLMGFFTNITMLTYVLKTGSSIEIVLLSLGLADRLNLERRHKERLQAEKQKFEFQNKILASVDTRTLMPNRAQLQQYLEQYLREKKGFSLALLKVKGFKKINNTLGYERGDELLKLVGMKIDAEVENEGLRWLSVGKNSQEIESKVAVADSLTFAVIFKDCDVKQMDQAMLRLRDKISGTIEFAEVILDIEILLGLSVVEQGVAKDVLQVIHEAQVGLAAATKFESRVGIYSPLIDPYSEEQLSLMGNLREAVDKEQLDLFCQPQIDLETTQLVGFEALLRWRDKHGNMVSPAHFIPLAESCGVIKPLSRWVIRQSLMRLSELQKHAFLQTANPLKISINLSVSNLREEDLFDFVREQIREFNVNPAHIKFEITESSMIENEEMALNRLLQLRRLGCQISIDDYGSGYASLGYLKQLPISEVKIDRSFISDLVENHDDQVIVKATITMCHELNLKVIAEGIETVEVANLLKSFGCDFAQGYFFGRPIPFTTQDIEVMVNQLALLEG